MAGELGFDSGTGSVGIVAVCGLFTAVRGAKMWSYVVLVGTGGVHTCFGCSAGLVKSLQHGAGIGFKGLEMVETGHSVVLGEGLGMVATVWLLLSGTGSWNEHGPEMAVTGSSAVV